MIKTLKRRGRPPSGRERQKLFLRVDPADAALFRAVRAARLEVGERMTLTDAELFRDAVRALVASLPAEVQAAIPERVIIPGKKRVAP